MARENDVRKVVRSAYAAVARKQGSCCGPSSCSCGSRASQPVPESDLGLSCGNPVAFSHLRKGHVVLDLGSGAGKDVFAAAMKVGATGRAIGVDMTPEMLTLARRNAVKLRKSTGLDNVEFRRGHIEELPVEDNSIDVAISNCVINLSPDKPQVFREVHRVLKPGGRMIVSDIVLNRELPARLKKDKDLYAACVAGALLRKDYLKAIRDAGFRPVKILSDKTYGASAVKGDPITEGAAKDLVGAAASITVLAKKQPR